VVLEYVLKYWYDNMTDTRVCKSNQHGLHSSFNNELKCVGIKSKDVDISISIVIKKAFSNISFLYQFGSF
jgi:hypothetical protein